MRLATRCTVIAAALAAIAIASPVATARPAPSGPGTMQTTVTVPALQLPEVHSAQTPAAHAAPQRPVGLNGDVRSSAKGPGVVHVTTHSSAFDWGAAAIGASVAFVIALLILGGGMLVTSRRRQRKPSRANALA
jgi:hypothetical protein